jgi:ubiquinone/menaquinone biosynthesis C-methylase UbiE
MRTVLDLITGLSLIRDHGRAEWLAETAAVGPGDTVLDVGCGPGNGLRAAARRGAKVIGLDPSPTMLWLAARRAAGTALLAAPVEAIPLPCGSVNVAWASGSFHHWPDVDAGLAEVARVLVPGGRLFIVERKAHGHGIAARHAISAASTDDLAARLSASEFTDIAVADTSPAGHPDLVMIHATVSGNGPK